MQDSSQEKQRIRQRFDVDLKAELTLEGTTATELQCQVLNLSASGACLSFKEAAACKQGMRVSVRLLIPETIMHIPNSGEIVWIKQKGNKTQAGIHFEDILSEIMMQRLVKNGLPETPYKPQ